MTHNLRITDSTTTIYLSEDDLYLGEYAPAVSLDNAPLRERLQVGFTRNINAIRGKVQAINRLFQQATNYQRTRTGNRVYVEFDPGNTGTYYRSELYNGRIEMTRETLGGEWGAANLELDMEWTRQPFWEGALTQLRLSNTSSTDNLTGITVNNRDDASGENWATIWGQDVEGDLPAPVKIQMLNATTDANATDEIYIFHNVYSAPLLFDPLIEGEASTDASATTDANSSAGAYGVLSWAATTETKIAEWALPSSDLDDAGGGRFAVLARWPAVFPYTNASLRLKLETASTYNALWTGSLSLVAPTTDTQRELNLLDTLRLPPYLQGQSSLKSIILSLYALRATTDTHTINLDYLYLAPISGDAGWKRFVSVSNGVGIDETFIYDGTEGFIYKTDSAGDAIAEFTDYGGPILLVPDVDQRLHFLTCDYLGAAEVAQSWTVKAWYRPRRSSI